MPVSSLSNLINKSTSGDNGNPQNVFIYKTPRVESILNTSAFSLTVGRLSSLWRLSGFPAGGNLPVSGEILDSDSAGAFPFVSATGGRESFLTQFWGTGSTAGTFILYDRLYHTGGLNATLTTSQTIQGTPPSPEIARYTNGLGNIMFIEIYDLIGATARTVSASYTNELGVSGRSTPTVAIGATSFREGSRCLLLPLQSGDLGVRSVQSVQILAGTTGIIGNFGVTIARPLSYISIGALGAPGWRDYVSGLPGIPKIEPGACLNLLFLPFNSTTASFELFAGYSIVEG